MPDHGLGLSWKSESVAKYMADNGIRNRHELAERLEEAFGIGRATVYRMFTEDWRGRASAEFLAAISRLLRVPLGKLVTDPSEGN